MKIDIWALISNADPLALIALGILLVVGSYKGIIKISWLNLPKRNKDNPHFNCIHNKSFNEAISRNIEKSIEVAKIQFGDTLRFQMNEAETIWIQIGDILKDNYWKQAIKEGLQNGEREASVAYYNILINNIKYDVMDIIRGWMKSNHFVEKTEVEFQVYIEDKIKRLIPKISDLIDHGFNRTALKVDMHELHQSAVECMPKIGALAAEFFHKARAISVSMKKLIDEIKEAP